MTFSDFGGIVFCSFFLQLTHGKRPDERIWQFYESVDVGPAGISGFSQHFFDFPFLISGKEIFMLGFEVLVDSRVSGKKFLAKAPVYFLFSAV